MVLLLQELGLKQDGYSKNSAETVEKKAIHGVGVHGVCSGCVE
jgi:hypothetical protein